LGDNIIGEDIGHKRDDYDFSRDPKLYNDNWMREAERNVKNNWEMGRWTPLLEQPDGWDKL